MMAIPIRVQVFEDIPARIHFDLYGKPLCNHGMGGRFELTKDAGKITCRNCPRLLADGRYSKLIQEEKDGTLA